VDTANIHTSITSSQSSSEREIQKLDPFVSEWKGDQSVCSTVGPSASMWVPAPYQNSALVDSVQLVGSQATPEEQPLSKKKESC